MSTEQKWKKSSYSGVNTNCVEVSTLPAATALRDSKNPQATILAVPTAEWSTFLHAVRRGTL